MRLVVLGSGLTALSVIRNARSNDIDPILIDKKKDIAAFSAHAKIIVNEHWDDEEFLRILISNSGKGSYLIATSDEWLAFIMRHRRSLDDAFDRVLCPSNEVLAICLDKQRFSSWCGEHEFPTPRVFRPGDGELESRIGAESKSGFVIRPQRSDPDNQAFPKVRLAGDLESLESEVAMLEKSGIEVLITESLLHHELIQYSVPFVRSEAGMRSFVARKIRPLPGVCAVGTYVSLDANSEVQNLGRQIVEKLDYFGIGEIEILYSMTDQRCYVIELNARPWMQYHLAVKSGYDLLKFLLRPDQYVSDRERESGKHWVNFSDDLYVCFSGSEGQVRLGDLTVGQYLQSMIRANVYPIFDASDLGPFIVNTWRLFKLICERV